MMGLHHHGFNSPIYMARNPEDGVKLVGMAVDGLAIALHHASALAPLVFHNLGHIRWRSK
jgi:hypothetical protein